MLQICFLIISVVFKLQMYITRDLLNAHFGAQNRRRSRSLIMIVSGIVIASCIKWPIRFIYLQLSTEAAPNPEIDFCTLELSIA